MEISIFTDKKYTPNNNDLKVSLRNTCSFWHSIGAYVHQKYPDAIDEWNYSGDKYGWSFRIKDKKRAIIHLLPRDKFFKVAFVFGQKATDIIINSEISESIKTELNAAKVYAEGRGIRIEIKDEILLKDIQFLIDVKLAN